MLLICKYCQIASKLTPTGFMFIFYFYIQNNELSYV